MKGKKRIVVLGGGFAGVACIKRLERRFGGGEVELILVSDDNYLLFTPMLPQVASGLLEARDVVVPIRAVVRRSAAYEAKVKNIDPYGKIIELWEESIEQHHTMSYDFLVVALGSETNFYGMGDVERHSYQMKTLNDAILLRHRMIDMLEQAENETDPILRRSLLTFVVVGAGFAGIETAGELYDFLQSVMKKYKSVATDDVRVVVLEAAGRILPSFPGDLADYAHGRLVGRGIKIMLRTAVSSFDGNEVLTKSLDGNEISSMQSKTVVWTAGVTPVGTIKRSLFRTDRGLIVVNGELEVPEFPGVFAIGDCALSVDEDGRPRAPTAQLAEAQGKVAADNIYAAARRGAKRGFHFQSKGQMAILGGFTGIALFRGVKLRGLSAWVMWRLIYLSKLPAWSKRLRVVHGWTMDVFFGRDTSRLRVFSGAGRDKNRLDEVDEAW